MGSDTCAAAAELLLFNALLRLLLSLYFSTKLNKVKRVVNGVGAEAEQQRSLALPTTSTVK